MKKLSTTASFILMSALLSGCFSSIGLEYSSGYSVGYEDRVLSIYLDDGRCYNSFNFKSVISDLNSDMLRTGAGLPVIDESYCALVKNDRKKANSILFVKGANIVCEIKMSYNSELKGPVFESESFKIYKDETSTEYLQILYAKNAATYLYCNEEGKIENINKDAYLSTREGWK